MTKEKRYKESFSSGAKQKLKNKKLCVSFSSPGVRKDLAPQVIALIVV